VTGVETSRGAIGCAVAVNAAGPWAQEVAAWVGLHLEIRPQRGQVLVTEKAPRLLGPFVLSGGYAAAKLEEQSERPAELATAQLASGNVLLGSTREFAADQVGTTPDALGSIAQEARRLLPGLGDLAVIRSFAGLRPYRPGGEPMVACAQEPLGFIVAAGHGGDGVALAPGTGRRVPQLVLEATGLNRGPLQAEN